jgi:CubicO group peptidase (beta-lactamase class C family)
MRPLLFALFGVSLLSAAANGAAPNTVPPQTIAPKNEQLPGLPDAQPERAPVQAARPAARVAPLVDRTPLKPHSVEDPVDLAAFFDGMLAEQIESKRIAGAVATVVVGNKIVFEKGYGYADVEARRRVDPEKTMFRIASVSKLFTWTAVMQLVEQGKLDLDADVNTYLKDFHVPATFEQPVTLKSLLTHTPGFEDSVIGMFGRQSESVKPLVEVLRQQMPTRVRPPGVLASYSNHGTALAGLVVATVSGVSWEDQVERTILQPLGMNYTLVRQPPKDKLPATMSKGYKWEGGRFKEQGFEYIPASPAGAISASGADMGRFMIAHLNDGRYENAHILKPETARRMRERLFTHDPKVDGMCYGFWELHRNGQRVLHHGGDTLLFHTLFALIPERHVGVFVSYNTDRGATGSDEALSLFLDRYYSVPDPPDPKPTAKVETLKRFAGEYEAARYSHTTYAKLVVFLQAYRIGVNDDGTLSAGSGARTRRYVQVEPLVFQQVDGRDRIVFREDDQGHITHLFFSDVPAIALVRQSGIQDTRLHWVLLAGAMTLFGTALLFWPAIAFSVRGMRSSSIRRTGFSALLSCLGWLLSALCVGFFAGLLILLNDPEQITFGTPRALKELLLIPQVCVGLAAIAVIGSLIAWTKRYWRLSGRLHYTLVALAGVGFCWFLYYWNLLQFGGTLPWMRS